MSSSSLTLSPAALGLPSQRRLGGVLATVLVHALLLVTWQMARSPSLPQPEGSDAAIQWVELPPLHRETAVPAPVPPPAVRPLPRPEQGPARSTAAPRPPPAGPVTQAPAQDVIAAPVDQPSPAPAAPQPTPNAKAILENALRSAGSIDRALRKDSKPLIVAPPDSPALRMRDGMEEAHALAPPRLWEAPKVEELVNNTGDGARRTRVITGRRTYCVTERSTATNVEMIEMHGKIRLTNCPTHETPAKRQEWRTARD